MNYGRGQATVYFLIMVMVCFMANAVVEHDPGTIFFVVIYFVTAYWGVAVLISWLR